MLGVLVCAAGVVQLGLGALRRGRWFRAVSVTVVQKMLAGIGIVLVAGQVYVMGDVSLGVASRAGGAGGVARASACGSRVRGGPGGVGRRAGA
ncbi:hypothetical protein GCM10023084_53470 [Streptomyces lacrimifluminis]|uniref:Uncharacterized protein n=1 Tax=Streptomyces lacrimifluminis TaxID=1500077 RepID=A0A917L9U0_9ACTN|nr:hypothetical protein GCM10012282_60590 [Streptomyces lacrimifluminis]